MQHIGDLQPFEPADYRADQPPLGRYSAKRSHWRFAVGSLQVGFDRAIEEIQAETPRIASQPARSDFGRRLMILVGMLTSAVLIVALAGWLSSRTGLIGGETVSAAIVDRGDAMPRTELAPATGKPILIPTPRPTARLSALIEQRKAAPVAAPAPRAVLPIASGSAIKAQPADDDAKPTPAPGDGIIASGNFLLIPGVARAASLAMASGEAQNWSAGSYQGLVVVGDAEQRAGKSCRQGTVLLRDGSNQGRTQKFEQCL